MRSEFYHRIYILLVAICLLPGEVHAQRYFVRKSTITFISDAPVERIEAVSIRLKGVIDLSVRTFAFSVPTNSFTGFNSQLQEEHFQENYVESEKYPNSTFTGKIIDEFDPAVPGKYSVRTKGIFTIRGVARERILKGVIEVKPEGLFLNVEFSLLLDDYAIRIPRVVYQKIAPEVTVKMKATLTQEYK